MKRNTINASTLLVALAAILLGCSERSSNEKLTLHEKEYLYKRGLNVLVFSNWYDGNFSDSKISGVEIIHHGVRTATNGDVRLHNTPEQWDAIPAFRKRKIMPDENAIRHSSTTQTMTLSTL